jgi:hypothetical protein
MKKILTVASLVMAGTLAVASSATALAAAGSATPLAQTAKALKQKLQPAAAKQKFRYLDMVQRKPPALIRKAVIVYDYGHGDSQCKSVSECLRGPAS